VGTSPSRLARTLGVEPGEGRAFAWGAATFFLAGWAVVSITNVGETLFLKRVGVAYLPLVFLGNSVLLAGTTFAVGRMAARTDHMRLVARTFFGLAAVLVPLWALVVSDVQSAFVLLVIASKQIDSVTAVVFWIALGGRLHGRQAKRLYAPIMAGGTLGTIVGSFASEAIADALGIPALLPVAAAALGAAGLMAVRAARRVPLGHRPAVQVSPPRRVLPALRRLWGEGGLFRLLVLAALLSGILGPMLYFQFSYVADMATQGSGGEQKLLRLYARFRGSLNVGVLAIQLLGTSRVFRWIGVPLAATLSPLVYLFGFVGLGVRMGLPAGVAAVAGVTLQDHAVYDPAQKILATLFRERVRAAATSLIEGPVRRAGGALGNVVVLAALALGTPTWVGIAGIPIAALWLAVTVALWRVYPSLLLEVASARRARADDGLPLAELVDAGTLRVLAASLVDADPLRCRAACELVVEAPPARAAEALTRALLAAPAANRPHLVEALHRLLDRAAGARLSVPDAARDLEVLLADPARFAVDERARLVQAYARLAPDRRPGSRAAGVLVRLADDPAPAVRLAATVPLGGPESDAMLAAALAGDDDVAREIAFEELRAALRAADGTASQRFDARVALLAEHLAVPRDRAAAATALADVAERHGERLAATAPLVVAHARDQDARVRTAVLRFVGATRLEEQAAWVVEHLASQDEGEARAARETLRQLGPAAANPLLEALQHGRRATRDAVLPLLGELPVDGRTLRLLADRELDTVRRRLVGIYGLGTGPVSELVLQRLAERVNEGVHTTLLFLATLFHEERIATLGHLLARSPAGRGRAVLLEALEALLPPVEAARLIPLLEDRSPRALAAVAAEALGQALPSFEEALRATLADQDPLTITFLAATLDADVLARAGAGLAGAGGEATTEPATLAAGVRLRDDDGAMLSPVEIVLHLRTLDVFAGLTTRQLSDLAGVVREETHPAGHAIVREGDFDDCMYLMVSGEVAITREGRFLARLGAKEFFGEMAMFDGETRAATATAETRVRLLRLERNDLFRVMEEQPAIAIAICQTLSRRLREQNERAGGGS
jgi:hypothetical protein